MTKKLKNNYPIDNPNIDYNCGLLLKELVRRGSDLEFIEETGMALANNSGHKEIIFDLVKKLRAKGQSVYCFIESDASISHCGDVGADPEQAMKDFEAISDWQHDPGVRTIFEADMDALRDAENVILLLPAGKSSHLEAGVAYGLGKHLILVGEQKEAESLYLIFNEFFASIDEFVNSL